MEDPDYRFFNRLWINCHLTVFRRKPSESASLYRDLIEANARAVPCSLRMFMLANMVAQQEQEKQVISHTEKAVATKFRPKMLTGKLAITRARNFQEVCHNQFGTFTLNNLSVLTSNDEADLLNLDEGVESKMLRSEVTAASWLVRYKIFNGGEGELPMYESEELQLSPEWLAIENTYIDLILRPYIERKIKGSPAVEQHRYNVFQIHTHYKKNLSLQRLAFLSRQHIMAEAVKKVCSVFNHKPDDFVYPRTPETNPMRFWLRLALTIRHYHCWLFINHEPSYFSSRRFSGS